MACTLKPPLRSALKPLITPWLPTVILVAGLSVAVAVVVGSDDVRENLPAFRLYFGQYAVGDAGGLDANLYSPFIEHRLEVRTVLLTIMYLISTCALGSVVIERIRGEDRWPWAVSVLAAFLPGYLITLAPLQVLFAAVPADTAAWTAVLAVPASAVVVQRRSIARGFRAAGHVGIGLRTALPTVLGAMSLVGLTAVFRIQVHRAFLVPDSIFYFLAGIDEQLQGLNGAYLAQWKQQSDEWLFSAPIALTTTSRDFLVPFYATQVISVVAFACLVFGLGRRFARRRHTAAGIAATVMVLLGTSVVYPWVYLVIVAGNSPVLASGQPGRHIGTLAPWATLLLLRRHPPTALIAIVMMTLGLGFTSLSVAASVAVTVVVALGFRLVRQLIPRSRHRFAAAARARGVNVAVAALPPALIIATFWALEGSTSPSSAAWWLVAAVGVSMAGALLVALAGSSASPLDRPSISSSLVLPLLVISVVIAGGLTADAFGGSIREALGSVLPGYRFPLWARADQAQGLLSGLSLLSYSSASCDVYGLTCHLFQGFVLTYGFLLVLPLVAWSTMKRIGDDPVDDARRVAWLVMFAGLAVSLIVIYFSGISTGIQAVVVSRVLEAPYYGLLALSTIVLVEARDLRVLVPATTVLLTWTLVPFIAARWPQQMLHNGDWILQRVGIL